MGAKYSDGMFGKGVCDRSGQTFPYKEMCREPGTGLWVHKDEVDWENHVTHPQNKKVPKLSDAVALRITRPERTEPPI